MKKNNLYRWCKENDKEYLLDEWDAEKNREELGLEVDDVTYGSGKKAYWKCKKGHEWQAKVNDVRNGTKSCPYCSNHEVLVGYNDLKTWCLINNREQLIDEWNTNKNREELGLTIDNVAYGSSKKVHWRCYKGHEWDAKISNRSNGTGCPICSGNQILIGYNDLTATNPELAKEWHPTKNGDLKPTQVMKNTNKKAYWICNKGHEWDAVISSRNNSSGCPICSNQKILIGYNDLATTNSELAKEWHTIKNGGLKPTGVMKNTNKKVYWLCGKGHEWSALISDRNSGKGCPICANRNVLVGYNDLATTNPGLAKEWHPVKNVGLMPTQITKSSNKKAYWVCSKNHEWEATISSRDAGNQCPICSNQKVLAGYNDLATINPELSKEWHPTKNGDLNPTHVTKSSNKKAYWKCNKEHEWEAVISSRNIGNNCPHCSTYGTSFPEQYLYYALKSMFNSVSNRTKINSYEYDIYIEDIDLLIEYDGIYWHRTFNDKTDREEEKVINAKENGFDFISVKEVKSKKSPNIKNKVIRLNEKAKIKDLNSIIELIIQYVNNTYKLHIDPSISGDLEYIVRNIMRNNAI